MRRLAGIVALALLALPMVAHRAGAVSPGTQYSMEPKRAGLPFEVVHFPSAGDSTRLTGWWFGGPPAAPVLVLCPHGKGTMADLLPSVREFAKQGFTVMTFDLREFGPGGPGDADSLKTLIFASRWVDDAQGALAFARQRAPGRFVFAWGQDLGGPLALAVGARSRDAVDAIACEGLFRTVQEQLLWNGTAQVPDVAARHRMLVLGSDEPISTVPMLGVPLFVVYAMKDDVTPPDVTRDVTRRSLSRIDRWQLPDATHEGAELTPGYYERVGGWFKLMASMLPPRPAPAPPAPPADPKH